MLEQKKHSIICGEQMNKFFAALNQLIGKILFKAYTIIVSI